LASSALNNPPVNALSQPCAPASRLPSPKGNADSSISALVIHCEGRTFIAGADIREFGKPLQPPGLDAVIDAIENRPKPVIAAIHGTALAAGLKWRWGVIIAS